MQFYYCFSYSDIHLFLILFSGPTLLFNYILYETWGTCYVQYRNTRCEKQQMVSPISVNQFSAVTIETFVFAEEERLCSDWSIEPSVACK